MPAPEVVILAGANGVGKTTFARANLTLFIEQGAFLNADDVARDVNSSDVDAAAIEAARRILDRRRRFLEQRQSFCIETTLATRTLLRFVEEAGRVGYQTRLVFLFTPSPQLNELRVKQRVMAGGHNISTNTIRRRHVLGLRYFADYRKSCAEGIVFDARTRMPSEIVRKDGQGIHVIDADGWSLLVERIEAAGGAVP